MGKYELTDEKIKCGNLTLYRIKAIRDFGDIRKNELGGFIKSEDNLSQKGTAWVYGDARVCEDAQVYGDAWVCGDAEIKDISDYIVFKNFWSSGRYFTYTRSNKMWSVGCFYGTGDQLIKKAYKDSKVSGKNYERIVRYVEKVEEKEFKSIKE